MKNSRKIYTIFQKSSAIFLMLVLLWLTVSTPFVIATQQELAKQQISVDLPGSDCEDDNTDSSGNNNNIEEKVPVSNSFSEEYLHEHHIVSDFGSELTRSYNRENSGTYIAFHGELHAPPPNVA